MSDSDSVVQATVLEIAEITCPDRTSIEDGDTLREDLGFQSLDLAQLAATLEIKLGVDPFRKHVVVTLVRTVGDLCKAYATALADKAEGQ